jgi:hypothetical protein
MRHGYPLCSSDWPLSSPVSATVAVPRLRVYPAITGRRLLRLRYNHEKQLSPDRLIEVRDVTLTCATPPPPTHRESARHWTPRHRREHGCTCEDMSPRRRPTSHASIAAGRARTQARRRRPSPDAAAGVLHACHRRRRRCAPRGRGGGLAPRVATRLLTAS